jgi:hypothetical protein
MDGSHEAGVVARVADENGFKDQRFNACGYSLGATFAPTWMDFPMFGLQCSHRGFHLQDIDFKHSSG